MYLKWEQLTSRQGVPVFYNRFPGAKSVAMQLLVQVGATDDLAIGHPGLYHWFEHVPFRGTRKFPGGYVDMSGPIARHAGHVGASTGRASTVFEGEVPLVIWERTLEVLVDLVSQPLLRTRDINAERIIIRQEMASRRAHVAQLMYDYTRQVMFEDHPLGHPVLGYEKGLDAMSVHTLRAAYKGGYDRSRMTLFFSGDIAIPELMRRVNVLFDLLPDHGLSTRRGLVAKAPHTKWKAGVTSTFYHHNRGGGVSLYYRAPEIAALDYRYFMLQQLMTSGGMTSPLMHYLRTKRNLVYGASVSVQSYTGGGHLGIGAACEDRVTDSLRRAIAKFARDRSFLTADRLAEVRDQVNGGFDMVVVTPMRMVDTAVTGYLTEGMPETREVYRERKMAVTLDDIVTVADQLFSQKPWTFICKGERE